jgi:hypothetical protein
VLGTSLRDAAAKATDRATRLHLEDAQDQIAKALDPKFVRAAVGPVLQTPILLPGLDAGADGFLEGVNCFPDYAIRRQIGPAY